MDVNSLFDSGYKLEIFTNSCYQTLDYYIDTNLKVIEDNVTKTGKVDILELDVFAKQFTETQVLTTLVECKRGCNFNDLFKFSGISQLIGADENIMVSLSKQFEDIKAQAMKLNITILDPVELFNIVPLRKIPVFHMFYTWNIIKNSVMSKEYIKMSFSPTSQLSKVQDEAYRAVREYLSIINGKIWREPNLLSRAVSFTTLLERNKDFVRKVARIQKITPANKNSQYYIDSNEICQAAASLIIDVKLAYIICAVECSISRIDTSNINDLGFHNLVSKLSSNIDIAKQIPKFLQYFINIFGGVYFDSYEDKKNICDVINISVEEFNKIILLLKDLFVLPDIEIQWGFEEDFLVTNLKYTPAIFKAIGIENRKKLGFETNMFVHQNDWKFNLETWRQRNGTY